MSEGPRPFRNGTAPSSRSPSSAATESPAKSSQMTWHGRRKCVKENLQLREPGVGGDSRLSADFHMLPCHASRNRAALVQWSCERDHAIVRTTLFFPFDSAVLTFCSFTRFQHHFESGLHILQWLKHTKQEMWQSTTSPTTCGSSSMRTSTM